MKDHTKDQCHLDIVENLIGQNASFEAQKWIKAVDRGGVVHISEDAFRFFLAVDYATWRNLRVPNAISMEEKFHSKLMNLVVGNSDI